MMEVNVADLTWAPFIYPRGGRNEETVKSYVEALRIGAKFPPIKIQRVLITLATMMKKCMIGLSRIRISELSEMPILAKSTLYSPRDGT